MVYIWVYFSDLLPSLKLWLNVLPLSLSIMPYFSCHLFLIFSFLSLLGKWILLLFVQHFFLYSIDNFDSHFSCSLSFFFSTLLFFIPTFWVITHNNHFSFMALPWVEVHITQGWVRDKMRPVSALSTHNLCFWSKLRCTCPRREQSQHIIPREVELVKKGKVYYRIKIFGS